MEVGEVGMSDNCDPSLLPLDFPRKTLHHRQSQGRGGGSHRSQASSFSDLDNNNHPLEQPYPGEEEDSESASGLQFRQAVSKAYAYVANTRASRKSREKGAGSAKGTKRSATTKRTGSGNAAQDDKRVIGVKGVKGVKGVRGVKGVKSGREGGMGQRSTSRTRSSRSLSPASVSAPRGLSKSQRKPSSEKKTRRAPVEDNHGPPSDQGTLGGSTFESWTDSIAAHKAEGSIRLTSADMANPSATSASVAPAQDAPSMSLNRSYTRPYSGVGLGSFRQPFGSFWGMLHSKQSGACVDSSLGMQGISRRKEKDVEVSHREASRKQPSKPRSKSVTASTPATRQHSAEPPVGSLSQLATDRSFTRDAGMEVVGKGQRRQAGKREVGTRRGILAHWEGASERPERWKPATASSGPHLKARNNRQRGEGSSNPSMRRSKSVSASTGHGVRRPQGRQPGMEGVGYCSTMSSPISASTRKEKPSKSPMKRRSGRSQEGSVPAPTSKRRVTSLKEGRMKEGRQEPLEAYDIGSEAGALAADSTGAGLTTGRPEGGACSGNIGRSQRVAEHTLGTCRQGNHRPQGALDHTATKPASLTSAAAFPSQDAAPLARPPAGMEIARPRGASRQGEGAGSSTEASCISPQGPLSTTAHRVSSNPPASVLSEDPGFTPTDSVHQDRASTSDYTLSLSVGGAPSMVAAADATDQFNTERDVPRPDSACSRYSLPWSSMSGSTFSKYNMSMSSLPGEGTPCATGGIDSLIPDPGEVDEVPAGNQASRSEVPAGKVLLHDASEVWVKDDSPGLESTPGGVADALWSFPAGGQGGCQVDSGEKEAFAGKLSVVPGDELIDLHGCGLNALQGSQSNLRPPLKSSISAEHWGERERRQGREGGGEGRKSRNASCAPAHDAWHPAVAANELKVGTPGASSVAGENGGSKARRNYLGHAVLNKLECSKEGAAESAVEGSREGADERRGGQSGGSGEMLLEIESSGAAAGVLDVAGVPVEPTDEIAPVNKARRDVSHLTVEVPRILWGSHQPESVLSCRTSGRFSSRTGQQSSYAGFGAQGSSNKPMFAAVSGEGGIQRGVKGGGGRGRGWPYLGFDADESEDCIFQVGELYATSFEGDDGAKFEALPSLIEVNEPVEALPKANRQLTRARSQMSIRFSNDIGPSSLGSPGVRSMRIAYEFLASPGHARAALARREKILAFECSFQHDPEDVRDSLLRGVRQASRRQRVVLERSGGGKLNVMEEVL